ncbi:YdcF family protein [Gulbenkiania mobilis]|uniref:YdcF family protein n=1 Tax=Gulbenkiania mobilis TaxID=397457 RepID=UPI0006BBFDA7|nr:YdcF family protein [Gulbenkiania mobilis]
MPDLTSPAVLMRQLLGAFFLPPVSILLLALAGAWLARRVPRVGRSLLGLSGVLFYLLTLPQSAIWLNGFLETEPPASLGAVRATQAIVVLGGGIRPAPETGGMVLSADSGSRVRYGAWLARRTGLPLLVTGGAPKGGLAEGQVMAQVLAEDYGLVPRWVEAASDNTEANARNSARLLRAAGISHITLVTQAWHMRRALPYFRAQGLTVVPAPTGFTRYAETGVYRWLPTGRAMQETHQALREIVGLIYGRLRGY